VTHMLPSLGLNLVSHGLNLNLNAVWPRLGLGAMWLRFKLSVSGWIKIYLIKMAPSKIDSLNFGNSWLNNI